MNIEEISLIDVLKQCIDLLSFQARDKGIQLELIEESVRPEFVRTDGNRVKVNHNQSGFKRY